MSDFINNLVAGLAQSSGQGDSATGGQSMPVETTNTKVNDLGDRLNFGGISFGAPLQSRGQVSYRSGTGVVGLGIGALVISLGLAIVLLRR